MEYQQNWNTTLNLVTVVINCKHSRSKLQTSNSGPLETTHKRELQTSNSASSELRTSGHKPQACGSEN